MKSLPGRKKDPPGFFLSSPPVFHPVRHAVPGGVHLGRTVKVYPVWTTKQRTGVGKGNGLVSRRSFGEPSLRAGERARRFGFHRRDTKRSSERNFYFSNKGVKEVVWGIRSKWEEDGSQPLTRSVGKRLSSWFPS